MTVTRPALRYHGGKWRLAPWIIDHFPQHRVYVEPFGGGASVLLRKARVFAEVYNDLDGEVVNFFRVLRDRRASAELTRLLRLTPFSRAEMKEAYETPPPPLSQIVERARRLVIKSAMSFGGTGTSSRRSCPGFRKTRGIKQAPLQDWLNWIEAMPLLVARLQHVVIEEKDAGALMQEMDSATTLHYVDPPYLPSVRQPRQRKVYACEMSEADHVRLAAVLRGLKGMVVLSGYQSQLYKRLYKGWPVATKQTFGEKAQPRTEVLWFNRAAARQLPTFRSS